MKFILAFIAITIAIVVASELQVDTYVASIQFADWKKRYNKTYSTQEEHDQRFQNFMQTLVRVNERNQKSTSAVFGIGKFADMSVEEFRSTMLMKPFKPHAQDDPRGVYRAPAPKTGIPSSFDWRNHGAVTRVKDQEQCGSCWAFSVVETLESAWIVAGKGSASTTFGAPQQLVDCDWFNLGCNGGQPREAWDYIMRAGGLDSEDSYPYEGESGWCNFEEQGVIMNLTTWQWACGIDDEKTLVNNLLIKPISICVDASVWQDYTDGVLSAADCAYIPELDHCVQLVGYNTTDGPTPYYIVRNSWNTDWGLNGYILLEMNKDTCGLTVEASLPFV